MAANDPADAKLLGRSANEERRGADQCTVVDLPHEEVRDIRTTDRANRQSLGAVRTR